MDGSYHVERTTMHHVVQARDHGQELIRPVVPLDPRGFLVSDTASAASSTSFVYTVSGLKVRAYNGRWDRGLHVERIDGQCV